MLGTAEPEESPYCPTCHGKGKILREKDNGDGTFTQEVDYCEACDGTGLQSIDGDVD